jgi:hypothetical protein
VDGQQRVTIDPGKGLEKVIVTADEKDHVLRVVKGGRAFGTAGRSRNSRGRVSPRLEFALGETGPRGRRSA